MQMTKDQATADAFADSWNNLPTESVYTKDQFEDWLDPLGREDAQDKDVLELGCGNASLMFYMAQWNPAYLEGVDLGDSVRSAEKVMSGSACRNWKVVKNDLVSYNGRGFDLVYCIGVLHHLKDPGEGFRSVVRNTKPGGRFHCWVYAREGNNLIVYIVDPIRKVASRLPWWITKYILATGLVFPYFLYAKVIRALKDIRLIKKLPLYEYSLWIAKRNFHFFRHVAFDQLVTPQTAYIPRETVQAWLSGNPMIEPGSEYIIRRNGNSWKFGAKLKDKEPYEAG